jgi:hypothetical protein
LATHQKFSLLTKFWPFCGVNCGDRFYVDRDEVNEPIKVAPTTTRGGVFCVNLKKSYFDLLLGLADPDLSPRDLHALVERVTFGLVMTGHRQMPQ